MNQDTLENFTDEQQEVLKSIRVSRIILPVLIGIGAVGYLLWRQFDPEEFAKINWTIYTLFWILVTIVFVVARHLFYAARLRLLSNGAFDWRKSIELIFIWEFSSAVSPTSVGGSAVAFFILAQEKLPTAKTATIVLYTIVLDGLFFLLTLPVLFLFFGTHMIRPDADHIYDLGPWGWYFLFAFVLMTAYSALFYYGLFINPQQLKRFLVGITGIRFFRRYRRKAVELGNDMIVASRQLQAEDWKFHLNAFGMTFGAWVLRFLVLNTLILAFIPEVSKDLWTQFGLYSRLETMFVIILFSPTPGGAGFVEVLFSGFLTDYVPNPTYSTTISTLWRLLTFYSYLLAGAIIIPNWLRKVINERRRHRQAVEA